LTQLPQQHRLLQPPGRHVAVRRQHSGGQRWVKDPNNAVLTRLTTYEDCFLDLGCVPF